MMMWEPFSVDESTIMLQPPRNLYIEIWQIEDFEYNYSGKPFLKLKKTGGADHIEFAAKNLIKMSLPIQCVEAVFLGIYLTGTPS